MEDLNDLAFFVLVVQHGGFSAASRATGIEKTRLSRRVAALERRLGVRLLQRTTRTLALTEAGQRFYDHSRVVVEGAEVALESVAALRREPAGRVRLSCSVSMAQTSLASVLPGYLATYPKVRVVVDATDRAVNLIEERIDLALRAREQVDDVAGLVAKELGTARLSLVASPSYLERRGAPQSPEELARFETIGRPDEANGGTSTWKLLDAIGNTATATHEPRLLASNRQMQLEAAVRGIGIALLPETISSAALTSGLLERVLPDWSAAEHKIYVVYPSPRGMLPSVRSLIDYLVIHFPAALHPFASMT